MFFAFFSNSAFPASNSACRLLMTPSLRLAARSLLAESSREIAVLSASSSSLSLSSERVMPENSVGLSPIPAQS